MKIFKQKNLELMLSRISEVSALYCPVKQYAADTGDYVLNFDIWKTGAEVNLTHAQTVLSPKNFFFGPHEALYTAVVSDDISINPEMLPSGPFVIFGVHACDLRGIELLDGVFLEEPEDSFYKARRDAATVVTFACAKIEGACFCNMFDVDPQNPGGDVQVNQYDDYFIWQALTAKGDKLTKVVAGLLEECNIAAQNTEKNLDVRQIDESNEFKEYISAESLSKLPPADRLLEVFNSEKWEGLYKTCIACGTCTFLCPTCQCYDIVSFSTGNTVKCHRAWDSCMNEDFTKMAHGNPRNSHKERFRQRFMHKLVYHQKSGGKYGCVGCGRCVTKCPVNLSILKVIKALGE